MNPLFTHHPLTLPYGHLLAVITWLLAVAASLTACQDEDILQQPLASDTRSALTVTKPGGLIQQDNGLWKAVNCRVPMVGPGRLVNDINQQVKVVNLQTDQIKNIVDTDLTNHYAVPVTVSADLLYVPIASVKDLYHTYEAGQKVGMVYMDQQVQGASLLNLELLKNLTLTTYLKGKKQESSDAPTGGNAVTLDLLAFNVKSTVADRVISFTATKPFDEVVFGIKGVGVNAVSNLNLAIKYAFVGENPEYRATSEPQFASYWTGGFPSVSKNNIANEQNLVDANLDNSCAFTSQLGIKSYARINLKKEFPTGTEIGFNYQVDQILGLDLLGQESPTLSTFQANGSLVESSTPPTKLLSLSLIGSGKKLLTNLVTTKPCSQVEFKHPSKLLNVGGMRVYYAYVREGVQLDPANEFTFGNDSTYHFSYPLPTAETGHVSYQLLAYPYGSQPKISSVKGHQVINGLTHPGAYRIQAFYTSPSGKQLSHIATLYRRIVQQENACNQYITARSHGAYPVEPLGWSGCLLCLFNGQNHLSQAVDTDIHNYATAYFPTSVLEWLPAAAFQLNKTIEPNGQKLRTGFVVQINTHLLDLSALSLFKIKLYQGENLVAETGTTHQSAVKLGLIGHENGLVRLCITTNQAFNRLELWRKGTLDLLKSLRIHHVFFEPETCAATAETGAGMELMTHVKDQLMIDYNHTVLAGLLAVNNNATDLSYSIDESLCSGTLLQSTLSAVQKTTLAFTFRQQPAHQPIGIILGELPNLLDLKLAQIGELKAFRGGQLVASSNNPLVNILGANLISHHGRTYVEVVPTEPYDRLEFTLADGLKLLNDTKVCGVYSRRITPENTQISDTFIDKTATYRTCESTPLLIPYRLTNWTATTVSLYAFNPQNPTEFIRGEGQVDPQTQKLVIDFLPKGQYLLYVYSADGTTLLASDVKATVHPLVTTWAPQAGSTDWNHWENWTDGSPWTCTQVILPKQAAQYPILRSQEENTCDNLHLEAGAELVGYPHLTLGGNVFMEKAVQGGRAYLISCPLQETYTGDWFINPNISWGKQDYFTWQNENNYPEKRTTPVVYQRIWSHTAPEKIIVNGQLSTIDVGTAQWSAPFNAVAEPIQVGQGFSLQAGGAEDFNGYTFHFPKTHAQYRYFTVHGELTGQTEPVQRNRTNIGKWHALPSTLTLHNQKGTTFLMGNPAPCHLNIADFLKANPEIASVAVYDGNQANPLILSHGQLISNTQQPSQQIAPMEGFFVQAKTATQQLTVNLSPDMLGARQTTTIATRTNQANQPGLQVSAFNASCQVHCRVLLHPQASEAVCPGEDVPLCIDSQLPSPLSVFTTAQQQALAIQQTRAISRIPLGILASQKQTVTLHFNTTDPQWQHGHLKDELTGKTYPLHQSVTVNITGPCTDRFYLYPNMQPES